MQATIHGACMNPAMDGQAWVGGLRRRRGCVQLRQSLVRVREESDNDNDTEQTQITITQVILVL